MLQKPSHWCREGLAAEIGEMICCDEHHSIGFPGDQNEALKRVGNERGNRPFVVIRCHQKNTLRRLAETLQQYSKILNLNGVIITVPTDQDKGITRDTFFREKANIEAAVGDAPVILLEHMQKCPITSETITTFDFQLNATIGAIWALFRKENVQTNNIPVWFHSYGPRLTDEAVQGVRSSLDKSPYFLSIRTRREDLHIPDEDHARIDEIYQWLTNGCITKLSTAAIAFFKQLVRNTNMSWDLETLVHIGGFNPSFGGGKIAIDRLPEKLRTQDHKGITFSAAGEEDTDAWLRMMMAYPKIRTLFQKLLVDRRTHILYHDPDVVEGTDKWKRAWAAEPHPAHRFMFNDLATSPEEKASIALQAKIAQHGHRIPKDLRGVTFVDESDKE